MANGDLSGSQSDVSATNVGAGEQQPAVHKPAETSTNAWLRRWRRITQPTPPDIDTGIKIKQETTSLLSRAPFNIGFFLAAGAMSAYGIVLALGKITDVILLLLMALVIALGLSPLVEWLHRRGIRRGFCVFLVALLVIIVAGLAVWAIVPMVSEQVVLLYNQLPEFLEYLTKNPQIAAFNEQTHLITQLTTFLTSGDVIMWAFGGVTGAGQFMASLGFSIMLIVVLTLYFLASLPSIKEMLYNLSPASRRPRVKYLVNEMLKRVGGYISGLFTCSLMMTCYTAIVITLLSMFQNNGMIKYALALAALLMLLYFIPLIGSSIAIFTIAIVGFYHDTSTGILCLILLFAYQQFDAYFIQPRVMAKSVQVPGVAIIIGVIAGGYIAPPMGAILAVPIMASLMLLYREVLIPHLNRQ